MMLRGVLIVLLTITADFTLAAENYGKSDVTFKSGDLSLVGFLFKPEGPGPFPAVVWNHGSERNPGLTAQFDSVASIFVPAGYVVFAPVRRGHGRSEGRYFRDVVDEAWRKQGSVAANHLAVHLLEKEYLDDQLAGLSYLKGQTFVDEHRVAVAGCSFGGIEALLGAASHVGYKAAVSISPGALSWEGNPLLQDLLINSVRHIDIPVLLLQPAKDASLEPSRVLGAEFKRLNKWYAGKVYPATGPEAEQRHCFGGDRGMHVWADDAKQFLKGILDRSGAAQADPAAAAPAEH